MESLKPLLKLVDQGKRPIAEGVIAELDFMREELADLREQIKEKGATHVFRNGAQQYERRTPWFDSYVQLCARYNQLLKQLVVLLPKATGEAGDELDAFLASLKG